MSRFANLYKWSKSSKSAKSSAAFAFLSFEFCAKSHSLVYLGLVPLGLCCCGKAFSSCSRQGLLFVVVHRLLITVACLVGERRL